MGTREGTGWMWLNSAAYERDEWVWPGCAIGKKMNRIILTMIDILGVNKKIL